MMHFLNALFWKLLSLLLPKLNQRKCRTDFSISLLQCFRYVSSMQQFVRFFFFSGNSEVCYQSGHMKISSCLNASKDDLKYFLEEEKENPTKSPKISRCCWRRVKLWLHPLAYAIKITEVCLETNIKFTLYKFRRVNSVFIPMKSKMEKSPAKRTFKSWLCGIPVCCFSNWCIQSVFHW